MKKIERHSKRNQFSNIDGVFEPRSSDKKVRKAIAKQEQQKKDAAKAAEKVQKDGIKSHRAAQTKETLKRMDQNQKATNQRYKKEFFLIRWLRPKTDIEKIQAKEDKKRKIK